jgi:hypothetical protein
MKKRETPNTVSFNKRPTAQKNWRERRNFTLPMVEERNDERDDSKEKEKERT